MDPISNMLCAINNATSKKKDPKDPRFTWLVWDIASIHSPRPRAIFILE